MPKSVSLILHSRVWCCVHCIGFASFCWDLSRALTPEAGQTGIISTGVRFAAKQTHPQEANMNSYSLWKVFFGSSLRIAVLCQSFVGSASAQGGVNNSDLFSETLLSTMMQHDFDGQHQCVSARHIAIVIFSSPFTSSAQHHFSHYLGVTFHLLCDAAFITTSGSPFNYAWHV